MDNIYHNGYFATRTGKQAKSTLSLTRTVRYNSTRKRSELPNNQNEYANAQYSKKNLMNSGGDKYIHSSRQQVLSPGIKNRSMKAITKSKFTTSLNNTYSTSNQSLGNSSRSQSQMAYLPNINQRQQRSKDQNDVKNARITVTHKNSNSLNLTLNPMSIAGEESILQSKQSTSSKNNDVFNSTVQSKSNKSISGKLLKQYYSQTRIHTQIESKPYLKLYQQKNQMHDGDREKASSIAANIVVSKVQPNQSNIIFGMVDQIEHKKEKTLDLNLDTLVMLGQEERTKMKEVLSTKKGPTSPKKKLEKIKNTLKQSTVSDNLLSFNNTANYQIKVTSPPPHPQNNDNQQNTTSTDSPNDYFDQAKSVKKKKRLTLRRLMQQRKNVKQRSESIDMLGNGTEKNTETLKLPLDQDTGKSFDSFRTDLTPTLNRDCSANDQTPKSGNDGKNFEGKMNESRDVQQRKLRNKNLQKLVKLMQTDRLKKEILNKDPTLTNLCDETKAIFREDLLQKKMTIQSIKALPLSQKLEHIEKFNLDPKLVLSKTEQLTLKVQKDMHIPEQIKITNLKQLLHKSVTRVNKWVKNSLLAKYQHDFDFYMQNDKTVVDKNSLLYEKLLEEQRKRELLSSKLEASKGGYVDPNMRTIDLTHRKVINDLMAKFQLKNYQLIPIHDEKREELERKLQDVAKLQMELLKEHEQMERKLRAEKERKFAKWQIINQEYKKKQATMGPSLHILEACPSNEQQTQNPDNRDMSPVMSPKKFDKSLLAGLMPSIEDGNALGSESPTRKLSVISQRRDSLTKRDALEAKFRTYLMEIYDKNRDEQLIKKLDEELSNQDKLLKNINKDIDEYKYFKSKIRNGEMNYEQDPLVPDELYVKSGKTKHFSKNIALWEQQKISEKFKDLDFTRKQFRILK